MLSFAQEQIHSGQVYLNGQFLAKNLSQALYWFKEFVLRSNKAGVLKNVIVCLQVSDCCKEVSIKHR